MDTEAEIEMEIRIRAEIDQLLTEIEAGKEGTALFQLQVKRSGATIQDPWTLSSDDYPKTPFSPRVRFVPDVIPGIR